MTVTSPTRRRFFCIMAEYNIWGYPEGEPPQNNKKPDEDTNSAAQPQSVKMEWTGSSFQYRANPKPSAAPQPTKPEAWKGFGVEPPPRVVPLSAGEKARLTLVQQYERITGRKDSRAEIRSELDRRHMRSNPLPELPKLKNE